MLVNSTSEPIWGSTQQLALTPPNTDSSKEVQEFEPFGDDGLGFFDFLDIINPLHHLPFIGPMYRELTGDDLAAGPRMMGGALFFGPIGLVGSAIDVVLEELTGNDLGGNIMSAFNDSEETSSGGSAQSNAKIIENSSETISVQASNLITAGTNSADLVTSWAMSELNHRNIEAEKMGLGVPRQSYTHLLADTPKQNTLAQNTNPPNSRAQSIPPNEYAHLFAARPAEINRAHVAYRAADLRVKETLASEVKQDNPDTGAISDTGTISDKGGWFSAAMLDALAKSPPTISGTGLHSGTPENAPNVN